MTIEEAIALIEEAKAMGVCYPVEQRKAKFREEVERVLKELLNVSKL